jgi:hypothetical protein
LKGERKYPIIFTVSFIKESLPLFTGKTIRTQRASTMKY